MKTGAIVAIIAGVLGAAAIGGVAYDETEKEKCIASGGTWQGLFKTPHCVAGSVNTAQQNCIASGGTWANNQCTCPSGYTLDSNGSCAQGTSTTPAPPTNLQLSWDQSSMTAQSVNGTLSWSPSTGATSYKVTVGGQTQTVTGTSAPIQATPGATVNPSVAACN